MRRRLRSFGKKIVIFLNLLAVAGLLLSYLATHISPEKFTFLALFGIAYVFLLAINIVFVIFWLFVKRKLALLSLLTILVGYKHFDAYFQLFPDTGANKVAESKSLKVISYNVRLFGWYDWKNNTQYRDSLIEALVPEDADVYCFQEYFHNSEPGRFDTENRLKRKLRTPYIYSEYTNWVGRHEKYGIATFSKYPIVGKGKVRFKREDSNISIYTDLLIEGDTVRVYNGHIASIRFEPKDYRFMDEIKEGDQDLEPVLKDGLGVVEKLSIAYKKRAGQVSELLAHADTAHFPVIICGDFNDTPVSYSYSLINSKLKDSFRESGWGIGNTYIGKFPSFRIDYIFHGDRFRAVDYHTLPANISDHHGIGATLLWD